MLLGLILISGVLRLPYLFKLTHPFLNNIRVIYLICDVIIVTLEIKLDLTLLFLLWHGCLGLVPRYLMVPNLIHNLLATIRRQRRRMVLGNLQLQFSELLLREGNRFALLDLDCVVQDVQLTHSATLNVFVADLDAD